MKYMVVKTGYMLRAHVLGTKEEAALVYVKSLSKREKNMLDRLGYNTKDFLSIKRTAQGFEFLQLSTRRILSIRG